MPHIPDHLTHDPELVAAYAAGDATGPDLAAATELVASCTECADLHRDLRAIATALPELPPAVRPRDFRITPSRRRRCGPRAGAACSPPSPRPASGLPHPWARGLPPPASRACCSPARAGSRTRQPRRGGTNGAGTTGAQVPVEANPAALPDDSSAGASAAASGPAAAAPAPSAAASEGPAALAPHGAPSAATSAGIRNSTTGAAAPASPGDATRVEIKSSDDAFAVAPDAAPIAAPADNTALALIAAGLIVVGVLLVALRLGARLMV